MIAYSTNTPPPISAREALSAIDGAWDGRFEVSWHNGKKVTVTDPASGRKASCLFLGDETTVAGSCAEWLSVGKPGLPPTFDFDRKRAPDASHSTALTPVVRQVAKSHASEMVTEAFCDSFLLTDEEQETACEAYAEHLRSQGIGFVIAGSRVSEVAIMPADARRLRLLLEFRIFNPKLLASPVHYMLRNRYDHFVQQMADAGVPTERITSRPSETSRDLLQVTVDANAVMVSRLEVRDEEGTDKKVIHLPGMDCKLTLHGGAFYVSVVETQACARIYLGVRMRNDAKAARVTGGRPLGETMGAKMIGRAIAG